VKVQRCARELHPEGWTARGSCRWSRRERIGRSLLRGKGP
jgi:hypothetical protein